MRREVEFPLVDLILCLSDIIDLISPAINNHHKRVAYISLSIAEELGLTPEQQSEIMMAGALHDIGALSLKQKLELLQFDIDDPHEHGQQGYQLLKMFGPFTAIAEIIRYHHVPWDGGAGARFNGNPVPSGSHILHLADRVSLLDSNQENILNQIDPICDQIRGESDKLFVPEQVNAFLNLARKEYFWLDLVSPFLETTLVNKVQLPTLLLNLDGFVTLSRIFSHIIDFRSRFTATHSSGVAATCKALSKLIGFSEGECQMMEIAGYLHDLGKLAVPSELLEKPATLSKDEYNVIRSHAFHTQRSLGRIRSLNIINAWASSHHERLDGTGYPFHYNASNLSLGARIVAIADVFTALTEDRPYRKGMSHTDALQILQKMSDSCMIDPSIVLLLQQNFDEINSLRITAQQEASKEYREFFGADEMIP